MKEGSEKVGFWGWCTGTTQRDGTGREEGGGFRMGNTWHHAVADSCWCMGKPIQYCKVINLQLKKKTLNTGRTDSEAETSILWPWCKELTHWKRPWCWERLKAGGEGDDRGCDCWMASETQWTWVWVNSGSWWWTRRPGMLQSVGSQRVGHDWATELNWTELNWIKTIRKASSPDMLWFYKWSHRSWETWNPGVHQRIIHQKWKKSSGALFLIRVCSFK